MLKLEETSQVKILIWDRLGLVKGQSSDALNELIETELTKAKLLDK